jgi:2-polyprenyl-3-methyl-5-hydroxy-6-metoxy-1,4-benzoquinol methylase
MACVDLLPEHVLVRTSDLDQGAWNYRGILGWISRRRIAVVDRLLAGAAPGRLLEVGYGSGIFMPTLARHATELHGIDVHEKPAEVERVLADHGVTARLRTGSVTDLPYEDGAFDTVVAISVLEFVDDLDRACAELRRVLAPGGRLVVVTPGHSFVLDAGLRVLTGEQAEDTFDGRRERIRPTLARAFRVDAGRAVPPGAPASLRLYTALRLV